jgi:catechol 2,3-dioxygenase-like lactoylglutathione lyase family enzyme
MIAYTTLGVNDMSRSIAFYDAVFGALGAKRTTTSETWTGYAREGERDPVFLTRPWNRETATGGNGVMLAFVYLPYGLILLVSGAMFFVHRRRARAEREFDARAPLRDGPSTHWSHIWTESARVVNQRPFILVRDDGARVQVEPDARVVLHDDHSHIERHSHNQRTRFAEITPGERVHVTGTLVGASMAGSHTAGAYRSGSPMPVIRAPSIGRMVISTEVPGDTSARRMRHHRGWLVGVALLFAFISAVVVPTYQILSLSYSEVWARPVALRDWRVWRKPKNSRGYWAYYYSVRASYQDHATTRTVEDDVGHATHECAQAGNCARLPFVVSSLSPEVHQFGVAPSFTSGRVAVLVMLAIGMLIGWPLAVIGTRPWYLRRKVVDRQSGRL